MLKEIIEKERLIVILRDVSKDKIIPVLETLYESGVRLAEITFDQKGETDDEETAEKIRLASEHFREKMHIGAGTVLTKKQVKLTKKAGGEFIISPDTNVSVIKYTKKLGLISMPGAMTVSEIETAHTAGADYVKLFPAGVFGPHYLKDVNAPLSSVKLLAVGGVKYEDIPEYLKYGAYGFGVSSGIVNKALCDNEDYKTIKENAKKYVAACKEVK